MEYPTGAKLSEHVNKHAQLNEDLRQEALRLYAKMQPLLRRKRQILMIKELEQRREAVRLFMLDLNPVLDLYNEFSEKLKIGVRGKRADIDARFTEDALSQLVTGLSTPEIRELRRKRDQSVKRLAPALLQLRALKDELLRV